MAATTDDVHQPHVPAWKRLGLKLKYAKDTAGTPTTIKSSNARDTSSNTNIQPSLAMSSEQTQNDRPTKKRKTSPLPSRLGAASRVHPIATRSTSEKGSRSRDLSPSQAAKASVETEPDGSTSKQENGGVIGSVVPQDHPETLKRRKSVTFTGETKQNDGNSTSVDADATLGVEIATAEPALLPERKSKKGKVVIQDTAVQDGKTTGSRKKKGKPPKDADTNPDKPELVKYLELFHTDRSSWKFNKNKQNDLLKHLFDVRVIPSGLNSAISDYISGLQGAGPRARLAENATAILRTFAEKDGSLGETEAMNTRTARREAYFRAMWQQVKKWEDAGMPRSEYDDDQLQDMAGQIERGKRAESVLTALAQSEPSPPPTDIPAPGISSQAISSSTAARSPGKLRESCDRNRTASTRKRKQRTDVVSSSDSSSSDSDSDPHDQGKSTASHGPATAHTALQPTRAPPTLPKPAPLKTPAYQHDNLNMAYRPQNPSQLMNATAKPTKMVFDDDLLDTAFPKKKTYHELAPKRRKTEGQGKGKGRGFAYTHGTKDDESGSGEEDD